MRGKKRGSSSFLRVNRENINSIIPEGEDVIVSAVWAKAKGIIGDAITDWNPHAYRIVKTRRRGKRYKKVNAFKIENAVVENEIVLTDINPDEVF